MSRGLGRRQRQVLAALMQLEAKHGEGGFYVYAVLRAMADQGPQANTDMQQSAVRTRDQEHETAVRRRAAEGDLAAAEEVKRLGQISRVADLLLGGRSGRNPTYSEVCPNLSRVFALLARRGLVTRFGPQGLGGTLQLTQAGHKEASRPTADKRAHHRSAEAPIVIKLPS